MKDFKELASNESIEKTIAALKANNIDAFVVETENEAKEKVISMLPKGAEVMNMTSVTLTQVGLDKEIQESGNYNSVKAKLNKMDRATQGSEMQKLGAAPEYAVGSVHAVTETGEVIIASNTGSQLPAYAYASPHVIWVVGTQKIVADKPEGERRIYEYVLPLESVRLNKQYSMTAGSFVSKLLIVNREFQPGRVTVILVKKVLGF
ncbi:MAG TPA: lactate utilization protein [Candidatus Saccharimonadales bacterium]|nr:lactate utilization protein [Candidatus Saccharimonadales bacterium]